MTRFHLRRRLREKLWKVQERLGRGLTIGMPSAIFLFSILIFIYVLQEPISLAIFMPIYVGLVVFLLFFAKIFYNKKRFLKVYSVVLHPITGLGVLFIILKINFLAPFTLVAGLTWIFSSALFASFVVYVWLHSLRKGKYSSQTARIYLPTQKFKWYPLFFLITVVAIGIFTAAHPILSPLDFLLGSTYLLFLSYYFILLFMATSSVHFISSNELRKYCKIGLTEVKKGFEFYSKGEYREKKIFIKNYLSIFPVIVDLFNELVRGDYPDLIPHIPDSDLYTKALFASAVKDEPRLKETREGIKKMTDALKVGKPRKPINFNSFIEGLCLIAGKKPEFSSIPEAFEIQPSFKKTLPKMGSPVVLVGILAILITLGSVYLSVRISSPEGGYEWSKGIFGNDIAKWLFPIGEASIVNPKNDTEVIQTGWRGEDRLNGNGRGEYSFQVLNKHFRKIMITNVSITGPDPIMRVYTSNGTSHEVGAENILFEIENILIKSPSELTFEEYARETMMVTLIVRYDLRALRSVLEEEKLNQLNIFGWVQISVLYELKGIRENISENVDVNFTLPIAFFLE